MSSSNKIFACPYYVSNQNGDVFCVRCNSMGEPGVSVNRIVLPDKDAWDKFANRFCASDNGWKFCSVAWIYTDYFERDSY